MLYKITDENGKTGVSYENETQWREGVTHKAKGNGTKLCAEGIIHAYRNPYLAILCNPSQGDYNEGTMLIWEAKGKVVVDDKIKVGCKKLTTIRQIPKPIFTMAERMEVAIRLAMKVYQDPQFQERAKNWLSLSSEDRISVEIARTWTTWAIKAGVWSSKPTWASWTTWAIKAGVSYRTTIVTIKLVVKDNIC